jgi:hypothetical protein
VSRMRTKPVPEDYLLERFRAKDKPVPAIL